MFRCRMCAENPFSLFGLLGGSDPPRKIQDKSEKQKKKASSSSRMSKRNETNFNPRSEEEIDAAVKQWLEYAHPRAREFFSTSQQLEEVLREIAKGTDKNDDPILGPDDKNVYWYGDVTKDDFQAAIRMVKPGETTESVTYVNRVLAFIFATDESFEQLMKLPKEPFKMSSGDQLDIHLAHISLEV